MATTRNGPRRPPGTGSIYLTAEGHWVGTITLPGPDGRPVRKVVKSRDENVARARFARLQRLAATGAAAADSRTTVAEWLATWLDDFAPRTLSDGALADYRKTCRLWIVPYIGTVKLAKLDAGHVNRMLTALDERGLSPRVVRKARAVLRRALRQAQALKYVTDNAAALADAAKPGTKLIDALNPAEAEAVLAAARGDRFEALAVLLLMLGLRPVEALSLRWEHVDFDGASLRVVKSKTPAGVRHLALPKSAAAALRAHRAAQAAEQLAAVVWVDPGLVFTDDLGRPLLDKSARRRMLDWWHRLCRQAKIPGRRMYASRHTAATLMLNDGVPLELVSATLGHASLAITMDTYATVGPVLQRKAADAMDRRFGG